MPKIDVEIVKRVLERNELDIRTMNQVLQDIQEVIREEEQAKDEKPPPVKKQFVLLVSDPNGHLDGIDLTGWVTQIPEDDSPITVTERITKGAYEFNASPKGRRLPVQTIGEACESVPARFFKEFNVWVKSKEPLLVITTDNQIPMDLPSTE